MYINLTPYLGDFPTDSWVTVSQVTLSKNLDECVKEEETPYMCDDWRKSIKTTVGGLIWLMKVIRDYEKLFNRDGKSMYAGR